MKRAAIVAAIVMLLTMRPCMAQQPSPTPEAASVQGPTGKAVDGFVMSLIANTPTVHLGEPIWVTVVARNVSGQPHNGWIGPRGLYKFKVIDKDTGAVVLQSGKAIGEYPYMGHLYKIDAKGIMQTRFPLDVLYTFTVPGTYAVQVIKSAATIDFAVPPLRSNAVTITVLP